jgi:uncharacterized membrane-anchored protein YitT (DUF2179 family)
MTTAALHRDHGFSEITNRIRPILSNLGLIASGCLLFVVGMNAVMVDQGLLCGGLAGIALLLTYQFPFLDIGLVYFLMNIPLIVLGWLNIGRRFVLYSIFGALFFSATASLINMPPIQIEDPIMAALLAGVICGAGSGLILRSLGSAGGLDILAIYLNKKFGFRIGSIAFSLNAGVIAAGTYLHDINIALYSIVLLFTNARVIDAVISGFNMRKSVMIVSDHAAHIANDIIQRINRGVTFLDGEGAYSHKKKRIVMTVATITELPKLKELIFEADPNAFVVVHETMEVLGKRHSLPKAY